MNGMVSLWKKSQSSSFRPSLVRPKVRPYQTNNYYAVLLRQAQAEMEVKNIVYDEKSVPKGRKKRSEYAEESDESAGAAGAGDHRTGEAG